MIEFKISSLRRSYGENKLFGDAYLDSVANIECSFDFIVDDKLLFSEWHWNLVEFTDQLVKWCKSGMSESFRYYCMDTEEEDIFILAKVNGGYRFQSSWAEVESDRLFQSQEIISFIKRIKAKTIERVIAELQVDLREIEMLNFK